MTRVRSPQPGPVLRPRLGVVAPLVFGIVLVGVFGPTWRGDRAAVPGPRGTPWTLPIYADLTFETWLVARHAVTWAHAPRRLFDTEHCAPYEKTLTLGIPMLTQGLLGVPAALVTSEPALVYKFSLGVSVWLAALAMFVLVRRWTGLASAGLAAGLLFAFHPIRLGNIHHPSVWDASWTVFALFFAERLFAHGRWRDAAGLGLSCALQIAASFYPLLAATFLVPPLLLWFSWSYGRRAVRWTQVGVVAVCVAAAAAFVLGPYLSARATLGIERPESYEHFVFAPWATYWPGDPLSPGWVVLALAAVALAAGRRGVAIGGDPRLALVLGAACVAFMAAGDDTTRVLRDRFGVDVGLWNPYLALGELLPGLRSVRGIVRLSAGVHLVACILAGIGVAALVRRAGALAPAIALALVVLAGIEVTRPRALGLEPHYEWQAYPVRVPAETIAFFAELARLGNTGPLFEVPPDGLNLFTAPKRILRGFHHRRRTSACFGSYRPPGMEDLEAMAARLPERAAAEALHQASFTTLIVDGPVAIESLVRATRAPDSPLRLLHRSRRLAAFAIEP
jgi:hypothetical protein